MSNGDLTEHERQALWLMKHGGPCRVCEIATMVGVATCDMANIVTGIVRRGLASEVARHGGSARYAITEAGRTRLADASRHMDHA